VASGPVDREGGLPVSGPGDAAGGGSVSMAVNGLLSMSLGGPAIRVASGADVAFLTDMLVEAVNWHPDRTLARAEILASSELAHYVGGWPGRGEAGVIAESGATPLGAAWYRFLPAEHPGYGFVAADIPELTIGVAPAHRHRGIGRLLLTALIDTAREAGLQHLSLSVERANHAHALYCQLGFTVHASDTDADTMLLTLT
jgi:ribosomal protein S18 acetylase RimI-like enzyme